jgi:hypothetical protein
MNLAANIVKSVLRGATSSAKVRQLFFSEFLHGQFQLSIVYRRNTGKVIRRFLPALPCRNGG